MKKGLLILVTVSSVLVIGLLTNFYINDISLFREEEMVRALPIFRNTSKVGSFTTTWPDSNPGSGLAYHTDALPVEIFDFYEKALNGSGWSLENRTEPSGLESQGGIRYKRDKYWLQISVRGQKSPFTVTLLVQR